MSSKTQSFALGLLGHDLLPSSNVMKRAARVFRNNGLFKICGTRVERVLFPCAIRLLLYGEEQLSCISSQRFGVSQMKLGAEEVKALTKVSSGKPLLPELARISLLHLPGLLVMPV